MEGTRGSFVFVKIHIPSRLLLGATRTIINESELKYILVTKICVYGKVTMFAMQSKLEQNADRRYLMKIYLKLWREILSMYIHLR